MGTRFRVPLSFSFTTTALACAFLVLQFTCAHAAAQFDDGFGGFDPNAPGAVATTAPPPVTLTPSCTSVQDGSTNGTTGTTPSQTVVQLSGEGIFVASSLIIFVAIIAAGFLSSIGALVCLTTTYWLGGIISQKEFFAGFSNSGVAATALLFIIVSPLTKLPLIQRASRVAFGGRADGGHMWPLFKVCFITFLVTPFLPNPAQVALFTPIVRDVFRDSGLNPGLALMPMLVLIFANNCLTISSASNLILDGMARDHGLGPLPFFYLVPTNLPVAAVLCVAAVLIAPWLFDARPDGHGSPNAPGSPKGRKHFTTVMHVMPDSRAVGELCLTLLQRVPISLADAVKVHGVHRAGVDRVLELSADLEVQAEDELILSGSPEDLRAVRALLGLAWVGVADVSEEHLRRAHIRSPPVPAEGEAGGPDGVAPRPAFHSRRPSHVGGNLLPPAIAIEPPVSPSGAPAGAEPAAGDSGDGRSESRSSTPLRRARSLADVQREDKQKRRAARQSRTFLDRLKPHLPTARSTASIDPPSDPVAPGGVRPVGSVPDLDAIGNASFGHDNAPPVPNATFAEQPPGFPRAAQSSTSIVNVGAIKLSNALDKGLDAFEPMHAKHTVFASVVISYSNAAVGTRVSSRTFSRYYHCSVVAIKTVGNVDVYSSDMSLHVLEPGDVLLLRTHDTFVRDWTGSSDFFDVEGFGNRLDQELREHFFALPAFAPCGITLQNSRARLLRLPDWFPNVLIAVFAAVIAAAMAGIALNQAAVVAVIALVTFGFMTPREAVAFVDWNVVLTAGLSFGIGAATINSGFAAYVGHEVADSGLSGPHLVATLFAATGLLATIMGNQGTTQVMFPIALQLCQHLGLDPFMGVAIVANGCVAGFMTPFGGPANIMIMAPGGYEAADFLRFGTPMFIVYVLGSTLATCWHYDYW